MVLLHVHREALGAGQLLAGRDLYVLVGDHAIPVSYTHLDVYKRQAHERTGQLSAYFIRAAGSVSLALDPDLGAIEGVGGDVYKRQR